MAEHVIRLPDVGEGIAEAELVEWHVKVGDLVRADTTLAAVMTDKATVEIPSPVDGEIIWLGAEIGDKVAVGSDLVRLKIPGERDAASAAQPQPRAVAAEAAKPAPAARPRAAHSEDRGPTAVVSATPAPRPAQPAEPIPAPRATARAGAVRPVASPAVRLRAREAGIDLRQVPGTGPAGRITHEDLDAFAARDPRVVRSQALQPKSAVEDVKVIGLRRRIAEQMAVAHARIPHITYVEEVDVTALEELRETLNRRKRKEQPRLTLLPLGLRQAAARHGSHQDLLKGTLAYEDAKLAADNGVDGIIVSNHGGRVDDSGRATIETLPEIVEVVGARMPALVDSGFRRGTDIVKALAMGAQAVCIGRPYLWGLGAFGLPGVERVLEILRVETRAVMQQVGAPSIKHLTPMMVRRA